MLKTIKVLLMSAILGLSTAALAVVDINAANQEELQTLKGIGAKKAADIIAYREAHGGFKNVEELLNVKGVGKATLEKLRSDIVVAGDKGVAVEQAKSAGVEDKGGEADKAAATEKAGKGKAVKAVEDKAASDAKNTEGKGKEKVSKAKKATEAADKGN